MKKAANLLVAFLILILFNSAATGQTNYKFYGFVKLDVSYDFSKMSTGNYARWVEKSGGEQLNITARQSRFGLNFTGPEKNGIKTSGKIEVDFYGGGAENKNLLMLRKCYMKINFKNGVSILAGQASDVISPLVPSTVNYIVNWWAGNVGYRRPQVRFSMVSKLGKNTKLFLDAAAVRSIGGENTGEPCIQGRAALSFPLLNKRNTCVGISAHTGKEENSAKTWSYNFDMLIGLSKSLTLKGEYFNGENLDAYLGGIGQGVNLAGTGITSRGGWASLSINPGTCVSFNCGVSVDDPDDNVLDDGSRSENLCIFGNMFVNITDAAKIGFEISNWKTEYKNSDNKSSMRIQCAFIHGL